MTTFTKKELKALGEISFDTGVMYAKEKIMKLLNTTKLPTDKNYKYSNEYIDDWVNELKEKIIKIK
jgi:hypothetical protein